MAEPRPRASRAPKPRKASTPPDPSPADAPAARTRAPRPTRAQREQARREAARRRKAHRAGLRAIWRERLHRFGEWVVPPHTRDVGRAKAVLVLILNIAPFPGLGTVVYGKWERGLMQFLLTFLFLIGWVWAMADGVRIVRRAYGAPPHDGPRPAPR